MSDVKTIYLEEYTPPSHHITHTDLTFEIFDEHTLVINRMQITRLDQSVGSIYLNGEGLKLLCVKVDDVKAEGQFTQTDEGIDLVCDKDEFVLQIVTKMPPHRSLSNAGHDLHHQEEHRDPAQQQSTQSRLEHRRHFESVKHVLEKTENPGLRKPLFIYNYSMTSSSRNLAVRASIQMVWPRALGWWSEGETQRAFFRASGVSSMPVLFT